MASKGNPAAVWIWMDATVCLKKNRLGRGAGWHVDIALIRGADVYLFQRPSLSFDQGVPVHFRLLLCALTNSCPGTS